jgi:hypothetical protein
MPRRLTGHGSGRRCRRRRMADGEPLSDNLAHDRLHEALEALGEAPGATVHADTALGAARRGLRFLALALVRASVNSERD